MNFHGILSYKIRNAYERRAGAETGGCNDANSEPEEIMARASRPLGKQAVNIGSIYESSR